MGRPDPIPLIPTKLCPTSSQVLSLPVHLCYKETVIPHAVGRKTQKVSM